MGVRRRGVEKKGVFGGMEPAGYGSYLPGLPVSERTEAPKGERDRSMLGNSATRDVKSRKAADRGADAGDPYSCPLRKAYS